MKMRDIINLCEKPLGWDLGGSWITEHGDVIHVDHSAHLHHSDIALDHFSDEIMANDDGEYDDYSREVATSAAYGEGWIRVSTSGTKSFNVDWQRSPTMEAKRSLLTLIKNDANTYKTYTVEARGDFQEFDNVDDFVRNLRKVLR